MPKNLLIASCLLLLSLASFNSQASSTLRCNSQLISLGEKQRSVLNKCGTPTDKTFIGYKQVVNIYRHTHEVRIDEWLYGPRYGMYHLLRFEGGVLVKISSRR